MKWRLFTVLFILLLFVLMVQIKPCTMQSKAHAMCIPTGILSGQPGLAPGVSNMYNVLPPVEQRSGGRAADEMRGCCGNDRLRGLLNGTRHMLSAS